MNVTLERIKQSERSTLENLFSYYVYDMSEFMGWTVPSHGKFTFNQQSLNPYWQRDDHTPYFIYVGDELAGFALIRAYPENKEILDIEQFFVLRKFKGQGVGKRAFVNLSEKHKGNWQIRVLRQNKVALSFWKSAVERVVGEEYTCSLDLDIDLEMHFLRFEV
ncbi:acetyltransferase [Vibrio coralliilyticus]|uniref:GNAT family N-acetyltransferase n=1 Tax=Vibrio coralliilyticus TaxID=190893 RepID=UPI000810C557|nr:GNAT family N-acetyltransferase [Vibrio coralliilyticus]ANW26825.1 acetyltransferase [Vibrio coralliilyticus]